MSNRKGGRPSDVQGGDVAGITADLRAQLQSFVAFTSTVNSTLKDVNQIQSELDDDHKPIPIMKGRLDRAYDEVKTLTTDEISRLDKAVETLNMLIAMQTATESAGGSPPPQGVGPGASKRGPYNKKGKKNDAASSSAPSPAPSSAPSPLPHNSPTSTFVPLPRSGSSKGLPLSATNSGFSTPQRKLTVKQRKEIIQGALPLQVGRRVAFRQPQPKGALPSEKKEDWILVRIIAVVPGDKTKYAVEDVDFDPSTPGEGRWNTNLKSILPLPDLKDKRWQDLPPYPVGTVVMAMYPDTTSFYRGVVAGAPEEKKKKDRMYTIKFDDDEEPLKKVPVDMVVEE
ncbi:hypothetical protein T439DRAFT_327684 [Meredithblackwellia eburnea MCA 4105]